ncbi:hypothetical protein CVT26_008832 [Gymnopilus dilepis]|uniref:Uncharacterized protein n=1 Tax=Gymnopilus dilepis TaxID=231916 RepID=A0A409WP63_9AGAR|nr:hypothetical protein CVT26_008832 [Gymnopilus dilepis]
MFRALLLFPPGAATAASKDASSSSSLPKVTMEAPVAVKLVDDPTAGPVELAIAPQAIFTTAVGHSSKRTLASWHVTTPGEVVDLMLNLVKDVPYVPSPRRGASPAPAGGEEGKPEEKANL